MARLARVILTASVLAAASIGDASANMAKWSHEGEAHGPLVPRNDGDIGVDAEDLVFDVAPSLDHAAVTATYRMTHAGTAPTTAEVAFVVLDDERPSRRDGPPKAAIAIDGAPVTYRVVDVADVLEPMLEAWLAAHPDAPCEGECSSIEAWLRTRGSTEAWAVTLRREEALGAAQKVLPDEVAKIYAGWTKLRPDRPLHWLLFAIPFAAGASRTVTVTYEHVAGSDSGRSVNDVLSYEYALSPASRWARFGALHVTVRTPTKTKLHSSIPLTRTDGPSGVTYETTLPKLPAGDLSLELMSLEHVLFGMTNSTFYWLLLLVAMLAATLAIARTLGRRLGAVSSRGWRVVGSVFLGGPLVLGATSGVVVLVGAISPRHAFGFGYSAAFGILLAVALSTVIGIAVTAATASRRPHP